MEQILAGVDGSHSSLHALEWAAELARRGDLELGAARVFEPYSIAHGEARSVAFEEQREELERWCASLEARCARPRATLLEGEPVSALMEAAEFRHASLLVVGGRGAGGLATLHLGSVAHHLAHDAAVPLAIVPPTAVLSVNRIVVGVDGSPGSAGAVELTAELGGRLGVVVTAVYSPEPSVQRRCEDRASWRQCAHDEARRWAAPIEKAGVPLYIYVDANPDVHPVAALTDALRASWGSVAVVGARRHGGLGGRLGRVPLELVHRTGNAVILVPPE